MRDGIFIALLFFAGTFRLFAESSHPNMKDANFHQLQVFSATNLNICTPLPEDSLTHRCRKVESLARTNHDIGWEFKAGQIETNTYAQTGNMALAASKAQELMDKAHKRDNPLATGLSMQAIGDTYLFSGRLQQADSLFTEALPYIREHGDAFMQTELLLQKLHVSLSLKHIDASEKILSELRTLITNSDTGAGESIYAFMLNGYDLQIAILRSDAPRAKTLLALIEQQQPSDRFFAIWIDDLKAKYYTLTEDYEQALAYSDSSLMLARKGKNGYILRRALIAKATLLEKVGRDEDASALYQSIYTTTDSLYKFQYTSQIDSMHVTYWIDQKHMDNIKQRNRQHAKFIAGLCMLMVITAGIVLVVRRHNRKLLLSRLQLEKLRKASDDALRTKSLFLSNMSHELRTPLNAITGFSSILTDTPDLDDATRHECSEYIRQNADLLLKLINDVVDLSDLKGDMIQFSFAPCEVVELCRNVLKTVENVKRTEAKLQFAADIQQLEIVTDKDRLQQVLINLLINATKFTKSGMITLRVSFDKERNEAVFAVEDTGCGIPLEKQPHIFERFEKLHEGIQGAGLGLSICQLIVEHTGGRIWIDPAYTAGARFVFTHPLTHKELQR